MAKATGRHEALSLQCTEGHHGLCVAAGHAGELSRGGQVSFRGAGELRPAGSAFIMWPAPSSGVGPCEWCESRMRLPEAGGGDEGDGERR